MIPTARFINGTPPPRRGSDGAGGGKAHSGLIVGQLMARPGVWAVIEGIEHLAASSVAHHLRSYGVNNDLPVEAVCRDGSVYACYDDGSTS